MKTEDKVLTSVTKLFHDIDFAVVAEAHDYRVEYKIYEIVGLEEGEEDRPLFHKAGSTCHPDPVDKIEEAEVYASGYVKWDGCSNWIFDSQQDCMLHFCDKDSLTNIGTVLTRCWDMTKELCPNWLDV